MRTILSLLLSLLAGGKTSYAVCPLLSLFAKASWAHDTCSVNLISQHLLLTRG